MKEKTCFGCGAKIKIVPTDEIKENGKPAVRVVNPITETDHICGKVKWWEML